MRRYILGLVVGLTMGVVLLGAFLSSLILVPGPSAFRFFTLQESYRVGETVDFRFENLRGSPLCFGTTEPWTVERQIGGEWYRVEAHLSPRAIVFLEPGDSLEWDWVAQDDPDRELLGLPEVSPGDYRVRTGGWLCESPGAVPGGDWETHAYFRLLA